MWTVHKDSQDRTYYFNSVTKESSWVKPPELKSALERAFDASDWKQFQKDNAEYYFNSTTNETTWDLPPEFNDIKNSMVFEQQQLQISKVAPMMLNFHTRDEAENAWLEMLRIVGVEPDWTWEQCVKKASSHAVYRALKTVQERKECFEMYCHETKVEKDELKQQRFAKDEQRLQLLFSQGLDPNIRFKDAEKLFQENSTWTDCLPQNRRNIFFSWTDAQQTLEKHSLGEIKRSNLLKLESLFTELKIDHSVSWKSCKALLEKHPLYASDPNLSRMDPGELLVFFEDHVMALEQAFKKERNQRLQEQKTNERKIRDGYKDLLKHLPIKINHKTKWKDIYKHISSDPRYFAMFDTLGSSPLEIFWDMQYRIHERLTKAKHRLEDILHDLNYRISPESSWSQFIARYGKRVSSLDQELAVLCFDAMVAKQIREEKRFQDRKSRKKCEPLRHILKKLEPPIQENDRYEDVCERVKTSREYRDLGDTDRKLAFERFMQRFDDRKRRHHERPDRRKRTRSSDGSDSDRRRRGRRASEEEDGELQDL